MSNKMYEYFDRKPSEWSFQGFLDECDLEPPKKKIDCYIKRFEINRYREASIKKFFL